MITVKELKKDKEITAIIQTCEKQIDALAYTEHSTRHSSIVSSWTAQILRETGANENLVNLGEIAGYLHDIGNALSRFNHAQSGALLAYKLLTERGMSYEDSAEIMMAIGNHDETNGVPVSVLSSALIIADKSDVHKSRVRKKMLKKSMNIHDRVNLAVNRSYIKVDKENKIIFTIIDTDPKICSVSDYFEIYHKRMFMCKNAAELMGYTYGLIINDLRVL